MEKETKRREKKNTRDSRLTRGLALKLKWVSFCSVCSKGNSLEGTRASAHDIPILKKRSCSRALPFHVRQQICERPTRICTLEILTVPGHGASARSPGFLDTFRPADMGGALPEIEIQSTCGQAAVVNKRSRGGSKGRARQPENTEGRFAAVLPIQSSPRLCAFPSRSAKEE